MRSIEWEIDFDRLLQLRNSLFSTNPRLRQGFLAGQGFSSLSTQTRFAGLRAEGGWGIRSIEWEIDFDRLLQLRNSLFSTNPRLRRGFLADRDFLRFRLRPAPLGSQPRSGGRTKKYFS